MTDFPCDLTFTCHGRAYTVCRIGLLPRVKTSSPPFTTAIEVLLANMLSKHSTFGNKGFPYPVPLQLSTATLTSAREIMASGPD